MLQRFGRRGDGRIGCPAAWADFGTDVLLVEGFRDAGRIFVCSYGVRRGKLLLFGKEFVLRVIGFWRGIDGAFAVLTDQDNYSLQDPVALRVRCKL